MAELDHLVYASPDLDAGVAYIEELTGATAVVGGSHVGRGTRNALLTFDDRTYFEIIGVDPGQPEPERPRGFGLDGRTEPGLAGYAVHAIGDESLEDIADAIAGAQLDPGSIIEMSRRKPDGDLLAWKLSAGGDTSTGMQGALPFAIDWLGNPSPATTLPAMGALRRLSVSHPDPRIAEAIIALGLGDIVDVKPGPPNLTAMIDTPTGTIELT